MILWLNPFSGVSGDMLLGALLDLGAPLDAVRAAVASTGLTGWELTAGRVQRAGLAACQARVEVDDDVPARRAAELLTMAEAALPPAAGRLAAAAITALAEAEGRIHGVPAAEVHLHELGGVDTIVDTVGVAAALGALGVSAVWSAPLTLGAGVIEMRHGQFPAPAPATVALLDGVAVTGAPAGPAAGPAETVTPTGAALLRAAGCRYGPLPAMRVAGSGYGAGARDVPGRPNVLPALLGEPLHDRGAGRSGRGHRDADHGRDHSRRRDRGVARRPARAAAGRGCPGCLDHGRDRQEGPPGARRHRAVPGPARRARSRRGCSARRAALAHGATRCSAVRCPGRRSR